MGGQVFLSGTVQCGFRALGVSFASLDGRAKAASALHIPREDTIVDIFAHRVWLLISLAGLGERDWTGPTEDERVHGYGAGGTGPSSVRMRRGINHIIDVSD